MDDAVLTIVVIGVLGCTVLLLIMTVATRLMSVRRRVRYLQMEPRCRRRVEALILEGIGPGPVPAAERPLMLDMLLRHLTLLRGREADLIMRHLEDAGYIDELAGQLSYGRPWRRAAAADLLGRSRSARAVAPLSQALSDDDDDVRLVAARSLALIGTPDAVTALADSLVAPTRWALAMVADNLVLLGSAAVPALLRMLRRRDDPKAVAAAARILGEIRDPRTADQLQDVLKTAEDIDGRAQAAAALGKIGGRQAVAALMAALRDPAWEVRAQAAKALGRLGDPSAATALQQTMADASWWVRVNCGEALAQLGDAGREALRRVSAGADRYAAEQAAAVLKRLAHPGQHTTPVASASSPRLLTSNTRKASRRLAGVGQP